MSLNLKMLCSLSQIIRHHAFKNNWIVNRMKGGMWQVDVTFESSVIMNQWVRILWRISTIVRSDRLVTRPKWFEFVNSIHCHNLKWLAQCLPISISFSAFLMPWSRPNVSITDKMRCPLRVQYRKNRLYNPIKIDCFAPQTHPFWK